MNKKQKKNSQSSFKVNKMKKTNTYKKGFLAVEDAIRNLEGLTLAKDMIPELKKIKEKLADIIW